MIKKNKNCGITNVVSLNILFYSNRVVNSLVYIKCYDSIRVGLNHDTFKEVSESIFLYSHIFKRKHEKK